MSIRRSTRVSSRNSAPASYATVPAVKKRSAEDIAKMVAPKKPRTTKKLLSSNEAGPEFKKPALPITPLKKRRVATSADVPSLTPTPSLVGLMRASYSSGDMYSSTPPREDRPVGPHITNAQLATPGGSKSVAYTNGLPDSSPSKTGLPRPTATTGTLLDLANAHLISVDARMKPIIDQNSCNVFSAQGLAEVIEPFRTLISGICGQQVSSAAAKSIRNKFIALFNAPDVSPHVFPKPADVAATSIPRLREAGLSERKAEYIQGLAGKFASGELSADMLMKASDEEVMEKLIAVRGLGKWSVEMFACFGLKRMDILSTGDLGVQRGMAAFFGKDVKKLKAKGGGKWKYMSEQDMLDKSAPFAPYRSLFMWYMWRVSDVDVEMLKQ